MRFNTQSVATDPTLRAEADELGKQLREMDFQSPDHLVITLRDHFERHGMDRRVTYVNGTITINTTSGLLMRIRSNN